jgi:glycosyltransferase involved in cell wall biosynthesis
VKEGGRHRLLLYGLTSPFADRVTAVSAAAANRYLRFHAVPARKMSILTNGIDTDTFVPDSSRRKRMRATMHASSNFVWIAVGRLAPAKDYPNLLSAFRDVLASEPSTKLWIAGEGDTDKLERLWFDLIEVQHASSVTFLGLRRDIPDLLDAADGFILSSAWEGMPLVIGEAMAMGKVVVASDVGGVREIMGEAGEVVAAKSSRELSKAMLNVMGDSDQSRRERGAIARMRIQNSFSMHAKADEWEVLYKDVAMEERPS